MSRISIGIDNGIHGALVALEKDTGHMMHWIETPTLKSRKGNEVDVKKVYEWLDWVTDGSFENVTCTIEEPTGSQSARSAYSMGGSFHAVRAVFVLSQIRLNRITPHTWQKVMIPGRKKNETKERALTKARELWPQERWLRTARSRVPHDGAIDAALIAEYARRAGL